LLEQETDDLHQDATLPVGGPVSVRSPRLPVSTQDSALSFARASFLILPLPPFSSSFPYYINFSDLTEGIRTVAETHMDSSLQYMGASTVALEERGGVLAAASPRD
jgi:hypothetical protein